MNSTSKKWTVNAIKQANRDVGGHWFDPHTMECFGTEVLPQVYQGAGGIFFVTRDDDFQRVKGYTVRRFDPETSEVHSETQVAQIRSKAKAIKRARELAGDDVEMISERFKPVTILEQFAHDLQKHTDPSRGTESRTLTDAKRMISHAKTHHHMMERLCSDEGFCREINEEGEHPQVIRCRQRIEACARRLGCKGVLFSGDPRGCTVKLVFEDGYTNDFAKEGYCVPIG